ncbi:PAS domain-containing protein [Methylomonas sp. AM2-LC]|uniref:PAS domain-containing protein n=1 Tax=Methylomonas sp. AM2-LC TaxID=3153301 RepID=UPI0032639DA1
MLEKSIGESSAILNSNFIAIVIVKDMHIVWANSVMHLIFDYEPDELVGHPIRKLFFDQDSYAAFDKDVYSAIQKNTIYSGILPLKRKDNTKGIYEFNFSRFVDDADKVVGVIADRTASHYSVQQLEVSELRYRSVVENQTEIISRFLPDGTFVFVNDVFCRLFGKSADELIGHRWHPVAYPEDIPIIEASLSKMTPDNPVVTIENRVFVANGEILWMQFFNRGFFDAAGTLMETQSVGRDITKLKNTQLNLRESEEALQRAQSVGRIGSFLMSNDTETFKITKETARLFDLEDNGVTTFAEWFSRVHPDDQCQVDTTWRAALQGSAYDMTYRIVVKDQIRWIRAIAELQFDGNGRLSKAVGTVQDISDLKQIESNLRESDERLELALSGSGLVLWDWNILERKVTAGNRWFEMLGYTNEELGNEEDEWMNLINPKDFDRFKQKISAHLKGETASFYSEHQLRHKSGHWVSVEAKGKVTRRDKDNTPLRMVGTILDITQLKRLNEEGMDLLKQIESLIREGSSRLPVYAAKDNSAESLTKRQRQIIGMIANGMTSVEIGKKLHLATPTIISHRRNLMAKLELHSTAEVTRFAIDHGLLTSKELS